jgi:hypothetical protein
MEGSVPPNVEAGIAIDLLQEAATDRLAPQIMMMEKGLERAGNQMLQLAQTYYREPRMLIINGSGSKPKVERFEAADLGSGITVKVEAGSGLPRTRAGKQARVMEMLKMGMLTPAKAYKYMDMADFKTLQMQFEADEEQADREHEVIMDGGIVNQSAANAAQQQLMQMLQNPPVDPNTGLQQPPDPQMFTDLANEGLKPLAYENKTAHLEAHASFMKSAEFETMDPSVKERFYTHYELTQKAIQEEASPPGDPTKVSLQLRGAVGPTVGSKILNQSGLIDVTPEELLEPPLDTVVIDNKDKPNAPGIEGGDAADNANIASMQQAELIHQQKMRHAAEEKAAKVGL